MAERVGFNSSEESSVTVRDVLFCIVLCTLKIAITRLAEVPESETLGKAQPYKMQYPLY
jgi:hypothetical protein